MNRGSVMLWTAVLAGVLLGGGCSYDEGYFHRKVKKLDELAAKGSETAKQRIHKRRDELLAAFKKLPQGEGRQDALDALCRQARETVREAEKILEGKVVEEKKVDKKKLAAYQKKFVGHWEGGNMKLVIAENGKVEYERKKPSGATSRMNAFILDFRYDRFKVGFMGLGTTFRIDRAPYQDGDSWKMKIDGVELTRVSEGGPPPQFGTFVCTRYENGRCVDPATRFDAAKLGTIHLLHISRDVPEKGREFIVAWYAEDVGKAAPPNHKIVETPLAFEGEQGDYFTVHGNVSRPNNGWPVGRYRVEVRSKGELVAAVKFEITGSPPAKKQP